MMTSMIPGGGRPGVERGSNRWNQEGWSIAGLVWMHRGDL